MNKCFYEVKRYIQIVFFLLNFVSFIVVSIIYNKNKTSYTEYTALPKMSSNILIIIIYLILIIHSIYPKIICSFLSDNFHFLMTDRGKIISNISIGIMYWSCDDIPLLVFEIINFFSSFGLFLAEFIFECNILYNGIENEHEEEKNSNEFSNDIQK